MKHRFILSVCTSGLVVTSGCSPTSMAVKVGMYAVGKVVDDAESSNLADELIGRPPSSADAALGDRVDVFRDVNEHRRHWNTYPVKLDILNTQRYFVEVMNNRIVRVEKVRVDTGEVEIARALVYQAMVKGKPPRECEEKLGAGPPKLTVRSEKTGQLVQIYDGRLIQDVGGQKYIVLRFDAGGFCEKLLIVDVGASAGSPSRS